MQYKIIKRSKFKFSKSLESRSVLIADSRLLSRLTWSGAIYPVRAGEGLKSIDRFSKHIKCLLPLIDGLEAGPRTIVAVGGGSIGDFAGFVASVIKRGVEFQQVPTTWLAAIDSAHGGKTALNVGISKNQVGSFYPAHCCYLVKDLLKNQPPALLSQGYFELLKIALINSPSLASEITSSRQVDSNKMFQWLDSAISSKMQIVNADPYELTGERHVLNLGHTVGHVLENHCGLAHGWAVAHGIRFAIRWSHHKKMLSEIQLSRIEELLQKFKIPSVGSVPSKQKFIALLEQDKKRRGKKVRFVFVKKIGKTEVIEVSPIQIYNEWVRQSEN